MLVFLYGEDSYRSRQKLNEMVGHYKEIHKGGLSLIFFDGQNLDFEDFKNEIETVSMFKEKKLIVLENIFSNQKFKEEFLKEEKRLVESDNIVLLYENNEIDGRDRLLKFLKKNSKSQEFEILDGEKLKNWVKKEFKNHNIKIGEESLNMLIQFVGSDLWQMTNEINKIVSFKWKSQNMEISTNDIDLLVKPKIENDIFKTIDAISENKKKLAINLIHKHLEKGDAPLYLLSMIIYQFRNILEIKDLIEKHIPYFYILKKSALHPFVIKKSYQQAQKFSFQQLKKIYQKIFQVDLAVKTGKVGPETGLDMLIAGI